MKNFVFALLLGLALPVPLLRAQSPQRDTNPAVATAVCTSDRAVERGFKARHIVTKPVGGALRLTKRALGALADSAAKSAVVVGVPMTALGLAGKLSPDQAIGIGLGLWMGLTAYTSYQKTARWLVRKDKAATA